MRCITSKHAGLMWNMRARRRRRRKVGEEEEEEGLFRG
jgi:hypothetical protein